MVGPAAYLQLIDTFNAAFPNNRMEIDAVFAEGGRVCILWTFIGVHKGVGRIQRSKIKEVVSMFGNAGFQAMLTK